MNLLVNASGVPVDCPRSGRASERTALVEATQALLACWRAGPGQAFPNESVSSRMETADDGQRQTSPGARISILPYKVCVVGLH